MVHHSVPDDKKAGKSSGKASNKNASKSDPSVSLLLPARPSNSEKVYKASTSDDVSSSERIAAQLEQSIVDDITAGKPVSHQNTSASAREIGVNLVRSHLDDMQAVNERNWSPDGPLFKNKASYWEADLPSSSGLTGKITNAQFVATMQRITSAHPDYQVKAIDFNTNVDERNGRAEVYCNVETSGFFEGVTQRNVTLCEYHFIDGEWYHVAHRTMQGMDSQRMPFMG